MCRREKERESVEKANKLITLKVSSEAEYDKKKTLLAMHNTCHEFGEQSATVCFSLLNWLLAKTIHYEFQRQLNAVPSFDILSKHGKEQV